MDENQIYYLGQVEKNTIVLKQISKEGKIPQFNGNIDKISNASIIIATAQSSGTLPEKIGGNRYIIITDARSNESGLTYAVQFAISFGTSTIAIRNCNYTQAGNGKYSEWRYI